MSGITRSHLCLYMRYRLFKSAEVKLVFRSARQVCALPAQTCAPFALKRTGKLSRSPDKNRTYPRVRIGSLLAERVGFEPTKPLLGAYTISSRARSTGLRHLSVLPVLFNNTLFVSVCKVFSIETFGFFLRKKKRARLFRRARFCASGIDIFVNP